MIFIEILAAHFFENIFRNYDEKNWRIEVKIDC